MDDDISDEDLMLRYRDGDTDAFEALYLRHKGPVYRFVLRQCGREYADELYQDIWLKIVHSRLNYEVRSTFKTWLYRIARNRIIDHYRRHSIRPVGQSAEPLSSLSGDERLQPENRLESDSRHEQVLRAIAALPRDQQEAFLLKEEAGLNVDDIASTTGATYEAAKSRLRYAYRKLRQHLETIDGD